MTGVQTCALPISMSPCDMPFCSRYPRIVVPIFIEIETASTAPLAKSTGIVCMSAISHKVNMNHELVNGYLGVIRFPYQPRFIQNKLSRKTLTLT